MTGGVKCPPDLEPQPEDLCPDTYLYSAAEGRWFRMDDMPKPGYG